MDSIVIQGGKRLEGAIPISGAKNSALTLLPCAILTDEKLTLSNLPRLGITPQPNGAGRGGTVS